MIALNTLYSIKIVRFKNSNKTCNIFIPIIYLNIHQHVKKILRGLDDQGLINDY